MFQGSRLALCPRNFVQGTQQDGCRKSVLQHLRVGFAATMKLYQLGTGMVPVGFPLE